LTVALPIPVEDPVIITTSLELAFLVIYFKVTPVKNISNTILRAISTALRLAPNPNTRLFVFGIFIYLIYTFPLISHFNTATFGLLHDVIDGAWRIWVMKNASLSSLIENRIPFQAYPDGTPYFSTIPMYSADLVQLLLSRLPITPFFTLNFIGLLKFGLISVCMFNFLKLLRVSTGASLFGMLGFLLNPYMMSTFKLYGPNFLSLGLPLVAWRSLTFFSNRTRRQLLWLVISFLYFIGENYYYTYFSIVALALAFAIYLFIEVLLTRKNRVRNAIGVMVFSSIILIITMISPYIVAILKTNYGLSDSLIYATKSVFYLIPSSDHWLFGNRLLNFYASHSEGQDLLEMSHYLGVVLLLSSVFAIKSGQPLCRLFLILAVLSGLAASRELTTRYLSHSLGGFIFSLAPMFRHLCRFQIVIAFSMAALGAIGFHAAVSIQTPNPIRKSIPTALIALLILDFWSGTSRRYVHDFKKRMPMAYEDLSREADGPIVESPSYYYRARIFLQMFQIFHQRPVEQTISREPRFDWTSIESQKKAYDAGFRYWVILRDVGNILSEPFFHYPIWGDPRLGDFENVGYLHRVSHHPEGDLYKITRDFKVSQPLAFHESGFHIDSDQNSVFRWTSAPRSTVNILLPDSLFQKSVFHLKFDASALLTRQISINCGTENSNIDVSTPVKSYEIRCSRPKDGTFLKANFSDSSALKSIGEITGSGDPRIVGFYLGRLHVTAP
jgi:hypothetical protein